MSDQQSEFFIPNDKPSALLQQHKRRQLRSIVIGFVVAGLIVSAAMLGGAYWYLTADERLEGAASASDADGSVQVHKDEPVAGNNKPPVVVNAATTVEEFSDDSPPAGEESVAARSTVEDVTKQEVAQVSLQYLMRLMSNRPMVDPITKVIHVAHDKPSQQWFATGTIECAELGGSGGGEKNKYWMRTTIKREFG